MSANPYQAPAAKVADQNIDAGIEVTWGRASKVWWSLAWRMVLFGGLAGMVAGGVMGGVMAAAGAPPDRIGAVGGWLGFLISIPIAIWVVRWVLRKSWSDFRIALVPISK